MDRLSKWTGQKKIKNKNKEEKIKEFSAPYGALGYLWFFHYVMIDAGNSDPQQQSEVNAITGRRTGERLISVLIFSTVFVSELFVLEGLMHNTPQSVKIWEQALVSQPPAAFMGAWPAQEGAKKRSPTQPLLTRTKIKFFLLFEC